VNKKRLQIDYGEKICAAEVSTIAHLKPYTKVRKNLHINYQTGVFEKGSK